MPTSDNQVPNERPGVWSLPYIIYFSTVHLIGCVGIWYGLTYASGGILALAVAYFFLCHLSITIGSHRYFTHGAFEANPALEYVLLVLFAGVAQGPALYWVGKHTEHHENEDIPGKDPHTPKDGWFHSHMGWLLKKKGIAMPQTKYTRKFYKNKERFRAVWLQYRFHWYLMPLMAFGMPVLLGALMGDLLGGILVIGFARLMFQYHLTWVVNSAGHIVGERIDNRAANFGVIAFWGMRSLRLLSLVTIMPILAVFTVGEMWHANHHVSSAHWRLGRKWWELDPGAYVIWTLAKIGLITNLKEPANRLRVPQMTG